MSIIKQIGIDFLFCPFSAPTFYELGVPILSIVYDLQFIDYPDFFVESDRFYRQLHFDQICKLSDHVATISEFTRQSVVKNSALLPEQVTTIHIGLVHDFAAQPDLLEVQNLFDRLDIKPQGYLFYPANFWEHKNHRALLQAFQLFRQRFPDSDLKIVCTGALDERRGALSDEVAKMDLEQHVIMPGFLPDHEIGILYQGAKGLIFPSLYEGFGIPVLEAMNAGVPVSCSKVTSLPEIGGDAVLYFDPKNIQDISRAIESLEFDDSLRSQLAQKGKERLPLFGDARTMAQKYADLIHQILLVGKKIFIYNLRGLTDDSWFQENAYLALPVTSQERYLDLSICVPEWMPNGLHLSLLQDNCPAVKLDCARGQTLFETIELSRSSGIIEIHFSRVFSPTTMGLGEDTRLISASCKKFQIKASKGDLLFDALQNLG